MRVERSGGFAIAPFPAEFQASVGKPMAQTSQRRPLGDREFADSSVEGNGFELPVPRAMQERLKAIIAGFGCNPPSPDYLRLLSADITEGGPRRSLGTRSLTRAARRSFFSAASVHSSSAPISRE
jgi:hypothetical protein